jgi:hypothetical protein
MSLNGLGRSTRCACEFSTSTGSWFTAGAVAGERVEPCRTKGPCMMIALGWPGPSFSAIALHQYLDSYAGMNQGIRAQPPCRQERSKLGVRGMNARKIGQ